MNVVDHPRRKTLHHLHFKNGIDGGVSQTATRIRLEPNFSVNQFKRFPHAFDRCQIVRRSPGVTLVKTLAAFEDRGIGGKAFACELGRQHAVSRCKTGMKRLGHCPVVPNKTARHGCGDSKCGSYSVNFQSELFLTSDGGSQCSKRSRAMPTLFA